MAVVLVVFDQEADMVLIDLQPGADIDRNVRVGGSLLANYDTRNELVNVEVLSIKALLRPNVVNELRGLVGDMASTFNIPGLLWTNTNATASHRARTHVWVEAGELPTARNRPVARGTAPLVRPLVAA